MGMFDGWKHTVECPKCKTRKVMDEGSFDKDITKAEMMEKQKSTCCNETWVYIGLQPHNESILNIPILDNDSNLPMTFVHEEERHKNYSVETITAVPAKKEVEQGINKTKTINESVSILTKAQITLDSFIDTNKKMSGRYMTDIVRQVLEEDNEQTKTKLELLENTHPNFFADALKYIPKFLKNKYNLAPY